MKKPVLLLTTLATSTALIASALPAAAQSSVGSSRLSSQRTPSQNEGQNTDGGASPATVVSAGLIITMIGDIIGRGISDHVGFGSGDLGIMEKLNDKGEFLLVFGDSFRGNRFGQGEWLSPVGVVATRNDEGRIEILRPLNNGRRVEQLIDYEHHDGLTLIPSDVINIDGRLYMQGMWNRGIGNVLETEIWESRDQGATWRSIGHRPAHYLNGKANLITWDQAPDGWVYMMTTEFKRNDDVYLTRFRPNDIANYSAWQHYSVERGTWGSEHKPVLSENVRAGEMALRYIDGHWVLAMFNQETLAVEVRISQDIARDWNDVPVATVAVNGPWVNEQGPNNFSQLYGAYIVPGSTLDNMDLVISQWNTHDNSRYMSTQFNVKGLDRFFGIGEPSDASVTDQAAVVVEEAPVTAETQERLSEERAAEDAAVIMTTVED